MMLTLQISLLYIYIYVFVFCLYHPSASTIFHLMANCKIASNENCWGGEINGWTSTRCTHDSEWSCSLWDNYSNPWWLEVATWHMMSNLLSVFFHWFCEKKTVVGTVCMVFHGHVPSPLNAKFWNMTIQKLWFMDKQFQTQYIWTLLKMFNPTSLRNGWTYQLVTIATKYVIIAGWWQNQAYNLLRNWLDALCIHCNRFWLSASSMGPVVPLEQLAFL